jgi:glycosyltransferase involved in cell wall biosynthesis
MSSLSHHLAIFWPSVGWGGAERTMLKLAGGISSRGYKVDLVLVRTNGAFFSEVPKHVRIINLKSSRALVSLPALIAYLRREKPDILYSGLYTNIIALWAKRLARVSCRVIVSERAVLSSHVKMDSSDYRVRLLPHLVRRFYGWADGIVAVSKGVADDLVIKYGIPEDKIHVIYNPVITPELRTLAEAPLNHSWFKPGGPPVILAVGHLSAQKDFTTLIKAFAMVKQVCEARLIILGDGKDRAQLKALIKNLGVEKNVQMPGFVANPYPYMKKASLFVLSSRWEGLPGVLIEALYCGAPLVATDCPSGPREVLADGKYGRLIPVGDSGAMAQAIESCLAGNAIHPNRESWKIFESEHVINQYINLFQKFDCF